MAASAADRLIDLYRNNAAARGRLRCGSLTEQRWLDGFRDTTIWRVWKATVDARA